MIGEDLKGGGFNIKNMGKNFLLITNCLDVNGAGRESLQRRNYNILLDLYGQNLSVHEIRKKSIRGVPGLISAILFGHIDGIDALEIINIKSKIKKNNIKKIFVDGSNLGSICKEIKSLRLGVEVIVFYHNVEVRFFWGAFCANMGIKSFMVMLANLVGEVKSVRYSDKQICLNERDQGLIKKYYSAINTHVAYLSLNEFSYLANGSQKSEHAKCLESPYAIFVGSAFYANLSAVRWYKNYIANSVGIKLYVIGRGFGDHKNELDVLDKIVTVGSVEDLSIWYRNANFVVAPIFDGSGMKTKVAEALMYGKRIVGTTEAFIGYESSLPDSGFCCTGVNDFIAAMKVAERKFDKSSSEKLKNLFMEKYSYEASKRRIRFILDDDKELRTC